MARTATRQDATLRNVRAANKRNARLVQTVAAQAAAITVLTRRVTTMESVITALFDHVTDAPMKRKKPAERKKK